MRREKSSIRVFIILLFLNCTRSRNTLAKYGDSCEIRAGICMDEGEDGFIEINDVRIATWLCPSVTDQHSATLRTAYVAASCQVTKVLSILNGGETFLSDLFDQYQHTPSGAYFILVSSSHKAAKAFSDLWRNEGVYSKSQVLLHYLGMGDKERHQFRAPLVATDEQPRSLATNYSLCRDSVKGSEYEGHMSSTKSGKPCQHWSSQDPNRNSFKPGRYNTMENYCRNPNNDPGGPWCYMADEKGYEHCDVPFCQRESDGFAVISKKGFSYSHDAVVKVVPENMPKRVVETSFKIEKSSSCVTPLSPLHSVALNPAIHSLMDRDPERVLYPGENSWLHLVQSDPVACNGQVVGWQFIPANPGPVFFTVVKIIHEKLKVVGSTKVHIVDSMLSPELLPSYVCTRDEPILNVNIGDFYGFYTNTSSRLPALKLVHTPEYTSLTHPCGRQITWADVDLSLVIRLQANRLYNSRDEIVYSNTDSHTRYMSLALKPIFDSDFMYTCGCTLTSECRLHGDPHLVCTDGRCVCDHNFVYNRKFNRCLFSGRSLHMPTYTSSVYRDLPEFHSSQAVDLSQTMMPLMTDTFSRTKRETRPWWVLDMGLTTNVFGVKVAVPPLLSCHLAIWRDLAFYKAGKPPITILFANAYTDVPHQLGIRNIQVIQVHGPYPWRVTNGYISQLLNPDHTDGVHTYIWPQQLIVTDVAEIYRIYVLSIQSNWHCMGMDASDLISLPLQNYVDCVELYDKMSVNSTGNSQTRTSRANQMLVFMHAVEVNSHQYVLVHHNGGLISEINGKLVIGSAFTPLHILKSEEEPGDGPSTSMQILEDITTDTPVPPQVALQIRDSSGFCIELDSNGIVLKSECRTKMIVQRVFRKWKTRQYCDLDWNPVNVQKHARLTSSTETQDQYRHCYQVLGTSGGVAAAVTMTSIGADRQPVITLVDTHGKNVINRTWVYFSTSEPGVSDLQIGVASHFDGHFFLPEDWTQCTDLVALTEPGRNLRVDCNRPIRGRYVALYSNRVDYDQKIHLELADVQVYTLPGCLEGEDPRNCVLLNRCNDKNGACSTGCTENSTDPAGFICQCAPGFRQGFSACVDVDECLEKNAGCFHSCENSIGSYHCTCRTGFRLGSDGHYCEDYDECFEENVTCLHDCMNSVGSYYCKCYDGYHLHEEHSHLCVGPDTLHLRAALNLPYIEEFTQSRNMKFVLLREAVEQFLNTHICSDVTLVQPSGEPMPIVCVTEGTFSHRHFDDFIYVVIDFILLTSKRLTDKQRDQTLETLKGSVKGDKSFVTMGREVKLLTPPLALSTKQFIAASVATDCTTGEGQEPYCLNAGRCTMIEGYPICTCQMDYLGIRCNEYFIMKKLAPPAQHEDLVPYLAGLAGAMFVILTTAFLMVCMCCCGCTITTSLY